MLIAELDDNFPNFAAEAGSQSGAQEEKKTSVIDDLEAQLSNQQWLGGSQPSSADNEAFNSLKSAPSAASHPRAFAWYSLASKFRTANREKWTGSGASSKAAKPSATSSGKAQPSLNIGDL